MHYSIRIRIRFLLGVFENRNDIKKTYKINKTMRIFHNSAYWFKDGNLKGELHTSETLKNKDYYDGFQAFESEVLWVREPKIFTLTVLETNNLRNVIELNSYDYINKDHVFFQILGFCGEFHILCKINGNIITSNTYLKLMEKIDPNTEKQKRRINRLNLLKNAVEEHLSKWFLKYNTPIFRLIDYKNVELVTNLKSVNFQQIIPSGGIVLQAIERFLTNELASEPPTPTFTGDNKTKIVSHGFDLKTSFRNM